MKITVALFVVLGLLFIGFGTVGPGVFWPDWPWGHWFR